MIAGRESGPWRQLLCWRAQANRLGLRRAEAGRGGQQALVRLDGGRPAVAGMAGVALAVTADAPLGAGSARRSPACHRGLAVMQAGEAHGQVLQQR
ncbi:hypothetical protein [Rhodanobacter lindaniclasticus]